MHGLCQDGIGVKVVEDEEVLFSSDGGGWKAAWEVGGDASRDGLADCVQVPCLTMRRVADGGLRFGFGLIGLRRRRSGELRQI